MYLGSDSSMKEIKVCAHPNVKKSYGEFVCLECGMYLTCILELDILDQFKVLRRIYKPTDIQD